MRAVLFISFLCALLALLNIGSGIYVALGAISSLSSLGIYFSYVIILVVTLYRHLSNGLQTSEWNLGRLGLPIHFLL